MSAHEAVHGTWCNSRTFPTHCRHCGMEVFYFSCSCGCKVFFESLGPPWPEHDCIERKVDTFGKENVEDALASIMMQPGYSRRGLQIEREYTEKVRRQSEADRKQPREIMPMEPPAHLHDHKHRDLGRLTEVIEQVDAYKRAHLNPDSVMAYALLREFTIEPMCQVTFVVDDLQLDDPESYTCFVTRSLLKASGAKRGDLVEFELVVRNHPALHCVWLCQGIILVT